jgi:membrane-associated protease RseP (regulator of RpoE activity)
MNATWHAGMIRRMGLGSVAALALFAHGARAQGGAAAGPLPSKYIIVKDSASGEMTLVLQMTRIDSLIKRRSALPMGTAEFVAVDSALQVALRSLPRPTQFTSEGGRMQIELAAPRVALRISSMDLIPQGWLGFTAALAVNRNWYDALGQYVEYFEYPTIVEVESNSPASRAGVRVGDLLLAYNGLDVRRQAINLTRLLEPGREVTVRVRRDGDAKEYEVRVEKAPPALAAERRAASAEFMATTAPGMEQRRIVELHAATAASGVRSPTPSAVRAPGAPVGAMVARTMPAMLPPNGMLGAAMMDVNPGVAKALRGMDGKRGVLVMTVPENTPAYRIGLRDGDVILRVESVEVWNTAVLRSRLREAEQASDKVKLSILRDGKTREISYAPPR